MTGLEDITAVKDLDKAMEDAGQEAKKRWPKLFKNLCLPQILQLVKN